MPAPRDLMTATLRFGQMLRAAGPRRHRLRGDGRRARARGGRPDGSRRGVPARSARCWPRASRSFPPSTAASTPSGSSTPTRGRGSTGLVGRRSRREARGRGASAASMSAAAGEAGAGRARGLGGGRAPDDGEPLEVPGHERPRGAHGPGLLHVSRRGPRRGRPPHGADRPAAGPAREPPPAADPPGRACSTSGARMRANMMKARDHRAPAPGAPAPEGAPRAALRRVRLDGPVQPLPSPVPLRAPERLRPRRDLHLRHAPDPRHRAPEGLRRIGLALRRLTDVRDFSGGTRIGESLQEFNRSWRHLVDRHTIVLLLSDGWDTGEPDVLAQRDADAQAPGRPRDLAQPAARQPVLRAARRAGWPRRCRWSTTSRPPTTSPACVTWRAI